MGEETKTQTKHKDKNKEQRKQNKPARQALGTLAEEVKVGGSRGLAGERI